MSNRITIRISNQQQYMIFPFKICYLWKKKFLVVGYLMLLQQIQGQPWLDLFVCWKLDWRKVHPLLLPLELRMKYCIYSILFNTVLRRGNWDPKTPIPAIHAFVCQEFWHGSVIVVLKECHLKTDIQHA